MPSLVRSVLLSMLMFAAAAPAARAQYLPGGNRESPTSSLDSYLGTVRSEVEAIAARWAQAWEGGDIAALATLYARDAMLIDPNDAVQGKRELRERLQRGLDRTSEVSLTFQDFRSSGDIAVLAGQMMYKVEQPGGGLLTQTGPFSLVLRRQWNGEWRIVSHVLPPVFS
jgi:uncharacterized protein (TIGR02246 family)